MCVRVDAGGVRNFSREESYGREPRPRTAVKDAQGGRKFVFAATKACPCQSHRAARPPLPPGTPHETMVFAVTKVRLDGCLFGPPSERDYRTVFRDRTVNGLDVVTGFHVATICHPVDTDTGTDWLVKLR